MPKEYAIYLRKSRADIEATTVPLISDSIFGCALFI